MVCSMVLVWKSVFYLLSLSICYILLFFPLLITLGMDNVYMWFNLPINLKVKSQIIKTKDTKIVCLCKPWSNKIFLHSKYNEITMTMMKSLVQRYHSLISHPSVFINFENLF